MTEVLSELHYHFMLASRDAAVLVVAIGAVLLTFGRWMAPAWRHMLWMLVALRLALPVLPTSPTSWQNFVSTESTKVTSVIGSALNDETLLPVSTGYVREQTSTVLISGDSALIPPEAMASVSVEQESENTPIKAETIWRFLGVVWFTGFVSMLVLIGVVTLRFYRRLRRLTIDDHPQFAAIQSLLENTCREVNFSRVPRLCITEAVFSPALTGLLRPEILLPPTTIERLSVSELRLVLLHELGHLSRYDMWTNWLLSILQAVHWFNPIIWWAFYRTRVEGERATDAWVLKHSGAEHAEIYGQVLIHLLKSPARPSAVPGVVGVIESRRDLGNRLSAIAGFTGKKSCLAVVGAAVLISGFAALGLTKAPEIKGNLKNGDSQKEKGKASRDSVGQNALSGNKDDRKVENFKFTYSSSGLRWVNALGKLSIWIESDDALDLGGGETLPLNIHFSSTGAKKDDGILGVGWWVPLLEGKMLRLTERSVKVTLFGGSSAILIADSNANPKDADQTLRSSDGKWVGVVDDSGQLDLEGPDGWQMVYRDGRIGSAVTPLGKRLRWNYGANKRVKSIVGEGGRELLFVESLSNGFAEKITVTGGISFNFEHGVYPQVKVVEGEMVVVDNLTRVDHLIKRMPDGKISKDLSFKLKPDRENKGYKMDFLRKEGGRSIEVNKFFWRAPDDVLISDSESFYKVTATEGNELPKIERKFSDGTQKSYWWDRASMTEYYSFRNGASFQKEFIGEPGPTYFKLKEVISKNAEGLLTKNTYYYDEKGVLLHAIFKRADCEIINQNQGGEASRIVSKNGRIIDFSDDLKVVYSEPLKDLMWISVAEKPWEFVSAPVVVQDALDHNLKLPPIKMSRN